MVDLNLKIPDGFLDEEVRSGYTVTTEMKKVWAVELDLLNELLRVCKEHDIKIFADGGTLLGAVREHGFIPWDDDIDLVMLRSDYDKLCSIAPKAFSHPYFLQNYHTDKGYPRCHAQFRNSLTTAILKDEIDSEYTFNQGIFLDIFVLDGLYEDEKKQLSQRKRGEILQKLLKHRCDPKSKKKIIHYGTKLIPWKCLIGLIDKVTQEKNEKGSKMVVNYGFSFTLGKNVTRREHRVYDEKPIYVDFEFMTIPIPSQYDEWLRSRYGDYMKPSKAGAVHSGVVFDTDCDYKEYLKRRKAKKAVSGK